MILNITKVEIYADVNVKEYNNEIKQKLLGLLKNSPYPLLLKYTISRTDTFKVK